MTGHGKLQNSLKMLYKRNKERKNDNSEGKVGKTKASRKRKRSRGSRW